MDAEAPRRGGCEGERRWRSGGRDSSGETVRLAGNPTNTRKNGNWEVLKIRKVYFHVIWEGEKSAAKEMLPAPEVSGGGAAIDYKPTPVININLLSVNI